VRLPGEAEWEAAAQAAGSSALAQANLAEDRRLQPCAPAAVPGEAAAAGVGLPDASGAAVAPALQQAFGDLWEWTHSAYGAYPGYRPWGGEVGEYNGKFMVEQYVLRGGSFATPRSHLRASYRNFFPASARWQFTGLRLARDAG
jgi:formylglycine-generating enzyme required for sulfatase activity